MVTMGSSDGTPTPTVQLVASGAPPAQDLRFVVPTLRRAGWNVFVVPTPHALMFLNCDELSSLTGNPVRSHFSAAPEDRLPPPDHVIAAPLTLNTLSKWAGGISDTLAVGVLIEAMGSDVPIAAIPWAKEALRRHPAFRPNLELLQSCGVEVIEASAGTEGTALDARQAVPNFPWQLMLKALAGPPTGPPRGRT